MTRATLLPEREPAMDASMQKRHWTMIALLLLVALVYWPGLQGGYVFDDFPNIIDNVALHVSRNATWPQWLAAVFSSPSSDLQRPLAMLSFALNHAMTGLDPYWMKLTNLGIHLLNTWLVCLLVRRILQSVDTPGAERDASRSGWIALWVAAAWALNPINLMGVLFVVQRMESLCHTFVFAGLLLYMMGRTQLRTTGRGWPMILGGLIGGTVLGALVKESAVLLPVYALALEWTLLGFSGIRSGREPRLVALHAAVIGLPAVLGLAWLLPRALDPQAFHGRDFTLGERLLTEGRVVTDYLHWTVLPNLNQLSLYHDDYAVSRGLLSPPGTLLALLLLAFLLGLMVLLRRRRPLMALGLAWFFAAQLLTATVLPLELMFEHRNYFASLGLCLVLADACLRAPGTQTLRRAGAAAAVALFLLYTGLTALRAREWNDQLRFSISEASKHPQSPRATYDVARNLVILSDFKADSPYASRAFAALEQAMDAPNSNILPESAAIMLAARSGVPVQPGWWTSLQRKLRTRPIGPQETAALGGLVDCQMSGSCELPREAMLQAFAAALHQGPNAEVLNIYGNYALNLLQDPNLAMQAWREAAKLAPGTLQYQVNLARMLIASGQLEEAASRIENIRRLGRLGQNEQLANELEALAEQSRRGRAPTPLPAPPSRAESTSPK